MPYVVVRQTSGLDPRYRYGLSILVIFSISPALSGRAFRWRQSASNRWTSSASAAAVLRPGGVIPRRCSERS
jgi:hypothetical protein